MFFKGPFWVACVAGVWKGRERGFWARETRGAREAEGKEGNPPSSRASRVSLAPKTPFPFPFKRLPRRLRKNGKGVPNLQSDNIKSSGKGDGREISLFQTDKQRLALSYTVILFFYSQCESLHSNWLAVNTARWTTNCTFYHLSIFFTTDFKFLWQVGGASRI